MPEKDLRKIDRLVAEKVMGHTVAAEYGEYWIERQDHMTVIDGKAVPVRDELPHYSSDIAAAMQVWHALRAQGVYLDVQTYADFYAVVARHESGVELVTVEVTSLPKAICEVALLVNGVEVPKDA